MTWTHYLVLGGAVLLTAALSCGLTLLVAQRLLRKRYVPQIRQEVDSALERLGDVVEQRVRKGVAEGITSLKSPDLVRWTREAVTDAADELVRGGLGSLLKKK